MSLFKQITLTGKLVDLIPLQAAHRDDLVRAASDGELWNLWYTGVPSEKTIDAYLDFAFKTQADGEALPFAVVDKSKNKIIGTTRFCHANHVHRRLEIGHTWYAKSAQKTGINTECKYLLLRHAFEQLGCIAVEFRGSVMNNLCGLTEKIFRLGNLKNRCIAELRNYFFRFLKRKIILSNAKIICFRTPHTHFHNHNSRRAGARLGAKQDGILRNHRIDPDGSLRDTVVFSIIESEWKTVKKALKFKLRVTS